MKIKFNENRGYLNITVGVPLKTRFCNLVEPDVHNGRKKWKLVLAWDEDAPELAELKNRLQAFLDAGYQKYYDDLPVSKQHAAKPKKNVDDSKLFTVEMQAPDDSSPAVPTGLVRMQAQRGYMNRDGEVQRVLVKNRNGDKIQLDSELPWDSLVMVKLTASVYGARAMKGNGPAIQNVGVTLYLDAIRIMAYGEGAGGGSSDWDDDMIQSALEATQSQADAITESREALTHAVEDHSVAAAGGDVEEDDFEDTPF
jgi:hypothetical protein